MEKRMEDLKRQIDDFLENNNGVDSLPLYINSYEKSLLEDYVRQHPKGGDDFCIQLGIFKAGYLEQDYRLIKK